MKHNPFANPYLEPQQIQQILDHWHVGRWKKIKMVDGYHKVTTNQGIFLIFALPVYKGSTKEVAQARQEERRLHIEHIQQLLDELTRQEMPATRLTLKNSRGEDDEQVSIAHHGPWHYWVYSVSAKPKETNNY